MYCFTSDERLADGAVRILREQLGAALDELSTHAGSLDEAVHEARRCVKRAKSLLRLIRAAIQDSYNRINRRLRAAGRQLSELRDAQAVIDTLLSLGKDEFRAAHEDLLKRKEKILDGPRSRAKVQTAIRELRAAIQSLHRLTLHDLDLEMLAAPVKATLNRGRKASAKAYAKPKPENFHEFRKRVKELRFQVELLAVTRPDLTERYANPAKKLDRYLGDDHNLAVLEEVLKGHKAVRKLIHKKQTKLRKKAKEVSSRIYSAASLPARSPSDPHERHAMPAPRLPANR